MALPVVPSEPPRENDDTASPPPGTQQIAGTLYEVIPQHALPIFNPHNTFKHQILSTRLVERYNQFMFKRRMLTSLLFNIGTVVSVVALVIPPASGQLLALLVPYLQLLGLVSVLMSSRPEMWRIIIPTFDFWFLTISNAIFFVCFAMLLGDSRILVVVMRCIFQQGAIITDASPTKSKHVAVGAFMDMLVLLLFGVLVGFGFIDESNRVVLFRYAQGKHSMSTRDLLLNTTVSLVVILGTLVYRHMHGEAHERERARRRSRIVPDDPPVSMTTCVLYHCVVRLRAMQSTTTSIGNLKPCVPPGYVQLRIHQNDSRYASGETIAVWFHQLSGIGQAIALLVLYSVGITGSVLCLICAIAFSSTNSPVFVNDVDLPAIAFICTVSFCFVQLLFCQRQLFRRLCTSFDFMFVVVNLTASQACFATILGGGQRQYLDWSMCIWLLWVILLDAITPDTRRLLRFKIICATPVLILCIATQIGAGLNIFVFDTWDSQDYVVFSVVVRGTARKLHMMPVLLSRLTTIISFSIRLLWRMLRRSCEEDCVFLHGVVAYEYNPKTHVHHVTHQ